MGMFFQKFINGFEVNPKLKIYNKRIIMPDMKVIKKIDLTFQSTKDLKR